MRSSVSSGLGPSEQREARSGPNYASQLMRLGGDSAQGEQLSSTVVCRLIPVYIHHCGLCGVVVVLSVVA